MDNTSFSLESDRKIYAQGLRDYGLKYGSLQDPLPNVHPSWVKAIIRPER